MLAVKISVIYMIFLMLNIHTCHSISPLYHECESSIFLFRILNNSKIAINTYPEKGMVTTHYCTCTYKVIHDI